MTLLAYALWFIGLLVWGRAMFFSIQATGNEERARVWRWCLAALIGVFLMFCGDQFRCLVKHAESLKQQVAELKAASAGGAK